MAAAAAGGASAGKQRIFACVECFRLRRKCVWQDEQCCKRCAAKGLVCHARQTMYRRKVRPRSDLFPHDALQISPPETLQPWHRLVPHAPSVQHQHRDAHAPYPEPPSQAHAHAQAQAQPRPQPQLQQLQLQLQHQQHALNVADHRQTTKQRDGQLNGAPHDDLLDEPQHLQDRFCQPALLDVSTMVTDRAPSQRGADKMGAPSLADGVDVGVAKPGSSAVPDLDLDLNLDLDLELELDLLPTYSNI